MLAYVDFSYRITIVDAVSAPLLSPVNGFIRRWQKLYQGKNGDYRQIGACIAIEKSDYFISEI
jgi:hypothetical protein